MARRVMMSEARVATTTDLMDTLLGAEVSAKIAALRGLRADIAAHMQNNYTTLLEPQDEAGVSHVERGLVALRVAVLEGSAPLIQHYRTYLAQHGAASDLVQAATFTTLSAPLSPRLVALLTHVDRLTLEPGTATPAHLGELKAHGLTDANIVTLSQLIAFLSFQVRALAGLQLLAEAA
jgi:CMD domain protein